MYRLNSKSHCCHNLARHMNKAIPRAQHCQVMRIGERRLCAFQSFQSRNQPCSRSPSCFVVKQRPGSQAKQGRKTDSADGQAAHLSASFQNIYLLFPYNQTCQSYCPFAPSSAPPLHRQPQPLLSFTTSRCFHYLSAISARAAGLSSQIPILTILYATINFFSSHPSSSLGTWVVSSYFAWDPRCPSFYYTSLGSRHS
jgi:hypothetical protein